MNVRLVLVRVIFFFWIFTFFARDAGKGSRQTCILKVIDTYSWSWRLLLNKMPSFFFFSFLLPCLVADKELGFWPVIFSFLLFGELVFRFFGKDSGTDIWGKNVNAPSASNRQQQHHQLPSKRCWLVYKHQWSLGLIHCSKDTNITTTSNKNNNNKKKRKKKRVISKGV